MRDSHYHSKAIQYCIAQPRLKKASYLCGKSQKLLAECVDHRFLYKTEKGKPRKIQMVCCSFEFSVFDSSALKPHSVIIFNDKWQV